MSNEIHLPIVKATSAVGVTVAAHADMAGKAVEEISRGAAYETWVFINSLPWNNISYMVAAAYTLVLMSEWFWKKLWRPLLERKGWIKPKPKLTLFSVDEYRQMSETQRADL